jgi:hypothetical protein
MTYALPNGTEPILDDYGNDTGEMKPVYDAPAEYKANISSAVGEEVVNVFGNATDYSRVICVAEKDCPIAVEGALINFNSKQYKVVKVADSLNGFLIAVREVM